MYSIVVMKEYMYHHYYFERVVKTDYFAYSEITNL